MAVGDLITAQRYNAMLQSVRNVLGKGSVASGYGQVLDSTDRTAVTDSVRALDMVNLLKDINKCLVHQTGSVSADLVNVIAGDIIADDVSDDTVLNSGDGDKKGYVDFENVITSLVNNKLNAFSNDYQVINSNATDTNWRVSVVHNAIITFDGGYATTNADGTAGTASGEDHYRHFFNSGGSIVFFGSVSADTSPGASASKNSNWNGMLSSIGQVLLSSTGISASSGAATTNAKPALDIIVDSTWRTYFEKFGSSFYSENKYTIEVRRPQANRLDFRVSMLDLDTTASDIDTPGYSPTDEYVTGTTASTIGMYRAADTASVNVPAPTTGTTSYVVTAG